MPAGTRPAARRP